MEELEITVPYNGEELVMPLKLFNWGHTYRIEVLVDGVPVILEPDEENSYRVIAESGVLNIDASLLQAIVSQLESLGG